MARSIFLSSSAVPSSHTKVGSASETRTSRAGPAADARSLATHFRRHYSARLWQSAASGKDTMLHQPRDKKSYGITDEGMAQDWTRDFIEACRLPFVAGRCFEWRDEVAEHQKKMRPKHAARFIGI